MGSIATRNPFALLGDDDEVDNFGNTVVREETRPAQPSKPAAVDQPAPRSGKRNAGDEQPSKGAGRPGGGRGGPTAGTNDNNRSRAPDDGVRKDRHPDRTRQSDEHRQMGDAGSRFHGGRGGKFTSGGTRTARDDRHSRTGIKEHEKQVNLAWGGNDGPVELADEEAGIAIAKEDEKAAEKEDRDAPGGFVPDTEGAFVPDTEGGLVPDTEGGFVPDTTSGEDGNAGAGGDFAAAPEPEEDKTKSYAEYMAELAEKRKALQAGVPEARKPNEGRTAEFEGKAVTHDDGDDYIKGEDAKKTRERQRKDKQLVELGDIGLPPSDLSRGGRGRGRGGRGRGDGGRGDGARGRGDFGGRGRGEFGGGRGGRGGFEGRGRGEFRGGRGGRGGPGGQRGADGPNIDDTSAFPTLGA